MASVPEAVFDPAEMAPIRGEESTHLRNLESVAIPIGRVAYLLIPELVNLRNDGIGPIEIEFAGADEISGTIRLNTSSEGEIFVRIRGQLGSELPTFRGVPFMANYSGTFFRQAAEGDPVIVEDGSEVKKDQMIAWDYKTKTVQWPNNAPISGIVHFAIEDDTPVEKGITVMYYIEETK